VSVGKTNDDILFEKCTTKLFAVPLDELQKEMRVNALNSTLVFGVGSPARIVL
jgi:hypothetical protein